MPNLVLQFANIQQPVEIEFDNTPNSEFFVNYLLSFKRPADRIGYAKSDQEILDEFLSRAHQAKQWFDFDWNLEFLTQQNFNLWHRDIETFDLSKHPPWSREKGDFFCDLHASLHMAESVLTRKDKNLSSSWQRHSVTVSWFAPSLSWPEQPIFKASQDIELGEIYTLFPHVGKTPWISLQQNDVENLLQSCKLPDACPPGFVINLSNKQTADKFKKQQKQEEIQLLTQWYHRNQDQLGQLFDLEKMLSYHGEYCIGRLKNIQQVEILQTATLSSVHIV